MVSGEQYSILLVDDDEVDRLTVKRAFLKANFAAILTEAQNGSEALAKLQEKKNNLANLSITSNNNFDIALLDYRLPDIDGLHLIERIRALNLDLPLIVLTGQGDEEVAVEIMKAGAADYISKSRIEANNLIKAINSAIRLHKAEQAAAAANLKVHANNELLTLKNQELEKQQHQIKLQNLKLQQAYHLKSQFLATISHELRTPMNAIMGFSQLLMRQYPDPLSQQQQNLVERIFNNSKNLLDMINEMLDFSRIEAGRLELNPQKFDLAFLIKLTVEELRSLAVHKNLRLVTDIQLKDNFLVQDSHFVKRTLINLLSNALKFTESGEINISAWEIDEKTVAIAVKDTGIGIAPEDHQKIFQAFQQVDQSFTRQHSGTGLGLAISASLIAMMGGELLLDSEVGIGSTFTIQIPRQYDP